MTTSNTSIITLLQNFVNQKSGLDFADYGDVSAFRKDQREISNGEKDFEELLTLAYRRLQTESGLEDALLAELKINNGRLEYNEQNKSLTYITGQYFPTEYRPAACSLLRSVIWKDYANEKESNTPNPVYNSGAEIRTAIKKRVSRRVAKNYFN